MEEEITEKKVGKLSKFFLKRLSRKTRKQLKKDAKTDKQKLKQRTQMVKAIYSLTDIFEIYIDDEKKVPVTSDSLLKLTDMELKELLMELLEKMERMI